MSHSNSELVPVLNLANMPFPVLYQLSAVLFPYQFNKYQTVYLKTALVHLPDFHTYSKQLLFTKLFSKTVFYCILVFIFIYIPFSITPFSFFMPLVL